MPLTVPLSDALARPAGWGTVQPGPPDRPRPVPPAEPIVGRILFAGGHEMPCTVMMRSPTRGEVRARARGEVGEVVICALAKVGILLGTIQESLPGSFEVAFALGDERRDRVAARLEGHAVEAERAARLRVAPRIVPLRRDVEVRLAERVVLRGAILNISMSGAAIVLRSDPGLFVGALVRVGERLAAVIRPIEGGAAVRFLEPFTPDTFDERVRP